MGRGSAGVAATAAETRKNADAAILKPLKPVVDAVLDSVWHPSPGPLFDAKAFEEAGLRDRMHISVKCMAQNGFAQSYTVVVIFLVKHVIYLAIAAWFVTFSTVDRADEHAFYEDAFTRFVAWNMLWEVNGFGCSGGPVGNFKFLHWLTPGNLKNPLRLNQRDGKTPVLPFLGAKRTYFDILIFVGICASLLRLLTAPVTTPALCVPVAVSLVFACFFDHGMYLACRAEVYGYMMVCLCFSDASGRWAGVQMVQLAIWFWAGVSKCGPWFASVLQIMLCNTSMLPVRPLKLHTRIYQGFPNDLRPTRFCYLLSIFGGATEFLVPMGLVLLNGTGTPFYLALLLCLGLHLFIILQLAWGTPQEWNIFTIIAAAYLFWFRGGIAMADVAGVTPALLLFVAFGDLFLPMVGNLFPQYVSFLTCMRYYAGNWPATLWLFKRSALHKLDKLTMSPVGRQGFHAFADVPALHALWMAWRSSHHHGKLLPKLIPMALDGDGDRIKEYLWQDGVMVGTFFSGYGFGDCYLAGTWLLRAVQDQCGFEPGELRMISVDSTPLLGRTMPWWIYDATDVDKPMKAGTNSVWAASMETQPY